MVLVWGGIRGGVSIALVLSMPEGEYKNLLLEITYIVVLFSIVVQGLTVGKLAREFWRKSKDLEIDKRAKKQDFCSLSLKFITENPKQKCFGFSLSFIFFRIIRFSVNINFSA